MTWILSENQEPPQKYHAIRCFTCECKVLSKAYLRFHRGHELHYVNAKNEITD